MSEKLDMSEKHEVSETLKLKLELAPRLAMLINYQLHKPSGPDT